MSVASDAADLASRLPVNHPVAQLARLRLDVEVRNERTQQMTDVYAPDPRATGTSMFGPNSMTFENGKASVHLEGLTPGTLSYLREKGYGIGEPAAPQPETPHSTTIDGSPAPDSRTIVSPLNAAGQPRTPGIRDAAATDYKGSA